jgi:hypothetical protein
VIPPAPLKAVLFDGPHDNIDGIEVLTDVGDLSMFLEFDTGPSKEVLYKDMMLHDNDGDSVLTNVGDLPLFLEQPMNSLEEPEGAADTSTGLGHAANGGQMVYLIIPLEEGNNNVSRILPWDPGTLVDIIHDPIFWLRYAKNSVKLLLSWDPGKHDMIYIGTQGKNLLDGWWSQFSGEEQWSLQYVDPAAVSVCSSISGIISDTIKQMTSRMCRCKSLIQFTHKPSAIPVLTVRAILFVYVQCLLASRLSRHLYPAGSLYAGWVQNSKHFSGTMNIHSMNLLLDFNVWEDSKSGILAIELCFQWDPGIIENVLMEALFVQLSWKSVELPVLYIQVIKLYSYTVSGHTIGYPIHNLLRDSVVWEITYNGATYWSGAVRLPLCLKLEMHDTLSTGTLRTWNPMVFSTVFHCWSLGSNGNEKNMSWHLQIQEEPCKCSNLCSLIGVSSNLQYKHKQWDPGIIQKDMVCFLKQYQQILTAKLQGCSEYVYDAFLPCRSHRAIAWGQAMFLRGGNVMTTHMDTMGRVALGHGLALPTGGWTHRVYSWRSCKRNGIDELKKGT